eukprot:424101-Rhodomonas_salina.2
MVKQQILPALAEAGMDAAPVKKALASVQVLVYPDSPPFCRFPSRLVPAALRFIWCYHPTACECMYDATVYVAVLQAKFDKFHHESDDYKKAQIARELRLETMIEARVAVDAAEAECPVR